MENDGKLRKRQYTLLLKHNMSNISKMQWWMPVISSYPNLTVRAIMMPILKLDSIELIYNWYGTLINSKVIHESERAGGMGSL